MVPGRHSLVLVLALASAACSAEEPVAADASIVDGSPTDTAFSFDVEAETGSGQACPYPACPIASPAAGTPCDAGVTCEYGTGPRAACNASASCAAGTWQVTAAPDAGWCAPAPSCPATFASAQTVTTCTTAAVCYYDDGTCGCVTITDGGLEWLCVQPSASCPLERPRLGSACTGNLLCEYGRFCHPLNGDVIQCACGVWQRATLPAPCPQ